MKRKVATVIALSICVVMIAACGIRDAAADKKIVDGVADGTIVETAMEESGEQTIFDKAVSMFSGKSESDTVDNKRTTAVSRNEDKDIITALIENQEVQENRLETADDPAQTGGMIDPDEENNSDPEEPFDITHPEAIENGDVEFSEQTLLVKFGKGFSGKVNDELKDADVLTLKPIFEMKDATWYTAFLSKKADVTESLKKIRSVKGVITAEYNYKYESSATSFDDAVADNPSVGQQQLLDTCGIKDSWNLLNEKSVAGGSSSVKVAVIDTGVDYEHEDLKANMWANKKEIPDNGIDDDGNGYIDDYYGVDITRGSGSGMDDNGHGTHVAGIIGASNNKAGIVGIAYNSKIMAIKAGDASGYFLQGNIARAIIYAYENGADVINMSFGGGANSIAVQDALEVAYSRCVLVASAGNDGKPNEEADSFPAPAPTYPAALSYVVGVMSVDNNDRESSFSNWDARVYNAYEYEVYAPGEGVLSTLPGGRYSVMSGTSMAAPVVAAQAALLRSYYSDTDIYPTKFIYGQIVGTADRTVSCCNPEKHTVNGKLHNLPGRVNFKSSIEKFPTPDIGISDYTLFDTAGYSEDTAGITDGCETVNNGDGIIDAGETIALGMTLKNRWGKSENTIVHIDANSDNGVANPYVTFLNNDIDYKSIGTYSEGDSGKVYSEDGAMWTGWKNPFYIKVDKDCPNDYTITLNVTVTYGNGLDETDTKTYTSNPVALVLKVRRGTILPNKIMEDMTLTSDNYYIIQNATTVMEGATLTIEEGTKIQFWCSDPEDAYAENGIAYIKVAGRLLSKGTEENPVEIFPSEWMGNYRVEIYSTPEGYASLKHTNVTNPYLDIDVAENCEFKQNYSGMLKYRFLSSGSVAQGYCEMIIQLDKANCCMFNKVVACVLKGKEYYSCIFIDSTINYSEIDIIEKCIFYGNTVDGANSSLLLKKNDNSIEVEDLFTNPKTGKTYIKVARIEQSGYVSNYVEIFDRFAKKLGGEIASINDISEFDYIAENLGPLTYNIGSQKDRETGKYYNHDGTEIPKGIPIMDSDDSIYGNFYREGFHFDRNFFETKKYLMEITGNINISEIELDDYIVNLDTDSTYKIGASVVPSTADSTTLLYESENPDIATVDAMGVITPVASGSTSIRVYAPDRAVYNYITVNVTENVIPESISAEKEEMVLSIGSSERITIDFTPDTATKRSLTFESSDDSVASVDERGVVSALKEGNAQITVTGYDGISTQVNVRCEVPAEKLEFQQEKYMTTLVKDDGRDFYPVITPSDATNQELVWESSNKEVCYVDNDGKLIKLKNGSATLRATIKGSNVYDEIDICISDNSTDANVKKVIQDYLHNTYAILDDGSLWAWGTNYKVPVQIIDSSVVDFIGMSYNYYVLEDNGKVFQYENDMSGKKSSVPVLENIESIYNSGSTSYYALAKDGTVWAWGNNVSGQLGDGSTTDHDTPVQMEMDIDIEVVDIAPISGCAALLDNNGNVYMVGGSSSAYTTPTLIQTNVIDICSSDRIYVNLGKECIIYDSRGNDSTWTIRDSKYNELCKYAEGAVYYINEGKVYFRGTNNESGRFGLGHTNPVNSNYSEFGEMLNVDKVKDVFVFYDNVYVITEGNQLFASGRGNNYQLGNGRTDNTCVPVRVYFGLTSNYDSLTVDNVNLTVISEDTNSLTESEFVIDFNEALVKNSQYGAISLKTSTGSSVSVTKEIKLDKFKIKPKSGFVSEESYTLTIPANAFSSKYGLQNDEMTYSFVYDGESTDKPAKETHDTVVDEEKIAVRDKITSENVTEAWKEFVEAGNNTRFYSNVILNRLSDDETSSWLRITAPEVADYTTIGLGGNYWGTTNKDLVNKQILDFDDFDGLADINEGEILTEAPSDTYPFVVDAYLETNGEKTSTVGNETVTFVVDFNRDMDTSIPLKVMFGSSYPYAEYTVEGEYVTDRQWRGEIKLNTLIENGYQYWNVSNGKAKGTSLKLYKDWGRFPFLIDTSSAQSLLMQANPTEEGIQLTWTQDDFDTLAGYNVYRSTEEDGLYTKLNRTVIPADTKEWFDDTVEPGQKYYYNFTVVESDLTESEPSGKVTVTAMDTMAPDIYHSPVYHAFTGSNLVISATVTDNVAIKEAKVYYRVKGQDAWNSKKMTNINDKYSAVIDSQYITVDGLEYYIEATDGNKFTYKGTADEPYEVTVQEAVSGSDMGDVDGNGAIEIKDAMMVLMAINDRLNLTEIQFARADLDGNGELAAKEALRIIQYVNGSVSSVLM